MQYIQLIIAVVLLAAVFGANKGYQTVCGTSPKKALGFNCLLGLFTFVIFLGINGFRISFTPFSFALSAIMNVILVSYSLIGFKLLESGTMALYTVFLMSGGMILPYIYGVIYLKEPFGILRFVALVLILFGVILSNGSGGKPSKKQFFMCIAVFILNGFVSIISMMHQIETVHSTVTAAEYVMLGGIFKFVFCGILFFSVKDKPEEKKTSDKKNIVLKAVSLIALAAVCDGVSYLLQLYGASNLPATVLYPFITGGGIVFSTVLGALVFGEKLTKRTVLSVAFCFCGTLMFL